MTDMIDEVEEATSMVGAADWDRRIAVLLARHAMDEEHVLDSYRWLLEQPLSPAVRYLVRLIVEDEERHHRLLQEMARSVAWGPVSDLRSDTIPALTPPADADQLTDLTDSYLSVERNDLAELKHIAREFRSLADSSPLRLLVDLMMLDTEKHIRILQFIKRTSRAHP